VREALYYRPAGGTNVICELCPKGCAIGEGRTGFCRVRRNKGGRLYAENYAACSAYALDPIEKKPLYHFYPGSSILSLGTWGCNFSCRFCQNWEIAQADPQTVELLPDEAVRLARKQEEGNIGIAFTYSEPSVWYEYIFDTAQAVRAAGLKNVLVTNGFINPKPLAALLPYIDAMNIDVKAYNSEYYRTICAGSLADVKRTVELAAQHCHVEITTLLVPGLNDDRTELAGLAKWLATVDADMPLHFSRYFPNYKMDTPPTPPATLDMAYRTARERLHYVYLGNAGGHGVNTHCPDCGLLVLDRIHRRNFLSGERKCPRCGKLIAIKGTVRYSS
jgi:pyruvate formate lyase activating enzyme